MSKKRNPDPAPSPVPDSAIALTVDVSVSCALWEDLAAGRSGFDAGALAQSVLPRALAHAAAAGLPDALRAAAAAEVSLLLSSDEEVRILNRDYRGKDKPTNVLSFAALDDADDGDGGTGIMDDIGGMDDVESGEYDAAEDEYEDEYEGGYEDEGGHEGEDEDEDGEEYDRAPENGPGRAAANSGVVRLALPDGEPLPLGDIVIAYETAAREAAAMEISLRDHVTHLLVHGILHLLGYDHEEDEDAETMESLEIQILEESGLKNPYSRPKFMA